MEVGEEGDALHLWLLSILLPSSLSLLQGKQKSYCFECFAKMPDATSGKGWLEGKLLYEEVMVV
jgi:hypothetical protein